jgi:hypothetical protein
MMKSNYVFKFFIQFMHLEDTMDLKLFDAFCIFLFFLFFPLQCQKHFPFLGFPFFIFMIF